MKKIAFVTGVTGQDGSYLSEFLLNKNYIVHGLKRRSSLINTFTTAYKLKTMANGAIVREYPKGYSVWVDHIKPTVLNLANHN